MAEIVLRGDINMAPGPNGGREIMVVDNGNLYHIRLDAKAARGLGEALCLSDEELQDRTERALAARKLVVPGNGSVPVPSQQ